MTENTDKWDAQLRTGVAYMSTLETQEEREAFRRNFRVSMGFESRFTAQSNTRRARFWNWLIDAESTTISGIPPIAVIGVAGFLAVVVVLAVKFP